MNKKILLVEPAYKTKYPPLGLMKLAAYHKKIKKDNVTFVKGCNKAVLNQYWDRIYISTLFTWTWDETVKTIKFYHSDNALFPPSSKCFVGGILASLMPKELFNATGVYPVEGLLDNSKKIEQDDKVVIDTLPPDYDILGQVENADFEYSNKNAYIGYTTRGCVWHCDFCAVKTLEPKYVQYIDIKKMIKGVCKIYGEKQDLLLMDNNVLYSKEFNRIIDDIKAGGFVKGATFGPTKIRRTVDFNQGLDAQFLTENKMKKLAEIPLEPMRIAFDDIKDKDAYVKAVRLAHKYGQVNMSNYVLYNYKDTPEDFYERLKINIDLNAEFKKNAVKTTIYSFPMRYIPLCATKRSIDTGNKHWNKRYLRSVKAILNVTKGPVMPGAEFFYQAFGRDREEFRAILSMPDRFIINRLVPNWKKIDDPEKRWMPYVKDWMHSYLEMSKTEQRELVGIMSADTHNDILNASKAVSNNRIKKLLNYDLKAEETLLKYGIKIS